MVELNAQQSLRIGPSTGRRIICLSGVVWLTREGDHRDTILAPGEFLDVARGLTVMTALEPTRLRIEKLQTASSSSPLLERLQAVLDWLNRSAQRLAFRGHLARRISIARYY